MKRKKETGLHRSKGPQQTFLQKKINKWPRNMWKDAQHHLSSGKCKSKPRGITSHPTEWSLSKKKTENKTSPAVHRLGIHLSMQGTQAWPLVEGSTRRGATKATCHSHWCPAPQSPFYNIREAHAQLKSSLSSLQLEKAHEYQQSPSAAKKKKNRKQ